MKLLCLVKQVPDPGAQVRLGSDLTLRRDSTAQSLNTADESAVELALRLRDIHGGQVTALTMGLPRAENMLRELIMRGVDAAALLTSPAFAGADTLATARTLSAAVRALGGYDLLLFGRRASDGETGQVGPMTAALLDIPCVVNVIRAEVVSGTLICDQLTETGIIRWSCVPPAALTLCEGRYPLRLPSLAGIRHAREAEIQRLTPADLAVSPETVGLKGSPTRVVRVTERSFGTRPTKWITPDQAAEALL